MQPTHYKSNVYILPDTFKIPEKVTLFWTKDFQHLFKFVCLRQKKPVLRRIYVVFYICLLENLPELKKVEWKEMFLLSIRQEIEGCSRLTIFEQLILKIIQKRKQVHFI